MANDPSNINLGPCRVRWGGVDLGFTKGGVEVEVTTQTKEVMVDQFGETPINEYVTGRKLSVKAPFAETDLDTMFALMRNVGATLTGGGVQASGTIAFSGAPANNDTITVNGTVFTFKTAPTLVRDVKVGGTAATSAQNLLDMLQASSDANVQAATYTLSGSTITATARALGTAGNAFTLAKTGTAITVPATLSSGAAATSARRVEVANAVGLSIQSSAKELVLHPMDVADNDFSKDFVVPLAGMAGGLTFAYQNDTERVFNTTFNGYPNAATGVLFIYGDKRSL